MGYLSILNTQINCSCEIKYLKKKLSQKNAFGVIKRYEIRAPKVFKRHH